MRTPGILHKVGLWGMGLAVLVGVVPSAYARELLDKILVRVNGVNILESDLKGLRAWNNTTMTLEEAIIRELYVQEVQRRKMMPSDSDIERYVAAYKTEHHLTTATDDELDTYLLKAVGMPLKRYREELAKFIAVSSLMGNEVKARVFVSKQEIERYHVQYPEWIEERYKLKTAFIPSEASLTPQQVQQKIKQEPLEWVETDDWVEKSALAESMAFVSSLKVGQISDPVVVDGGYQVVQLLEKQKRYARALADRYAAIETNLKKKKTRKVEQELEAELRGRASIVYLS